MVSTYLEDKRKIEQLQKQLADRRQGEIDRIRAEHLKELGDLELPFEEVWADHFGRSEAGKPSTKGKKRANFGDARPPTHRWKDAEGVVHFFRGGKPSEALKKSPYYKDGGILKDEMDPLSNEEQAAWLAANVKK